MRLASLVVRAAKDPLGAVDHMRSAAGLFARAGSPGEVLVALQTAVAARMCSVHGALALILSDGPAVALVLASKSSGVGAVSDVEPALICSRTILQAVIATLPGTPQLAGAPVAEH